MTTFELADRRAESLHRIYSLTYGALAGFAFALVCWGYDALLLARAHAMFPWVNWALGMLACTLLGTAAGWLAAALRHILTTFIVWVLVAAAFSWLVAHIPFEIYSAVLGIFAPGIRRLVDLPFTVDASYRMVLVTVAVIVGGIISGLLFNFLVDSSQEATAPVGAFLPLILWVGVFALAALPAEMEINALLRQPVVATDRVIQVALNPGANPLDSQTQSETGERAVNPLKDMLSRNYRILLTNFQDDMLGVNLAIRFDRGWATCSVLNSRPSYCQPVQESDLVKGK